MRSFFLLVILLLLYLPGFFTLPPIDRDESRFAQSSKQMVESGDYVDIRIQDVPRYKKPIGAYWLQALSAKTTGVVDKIWSYRVPSLLAAILSVLALFWFGIGIIGGRGAFISALLFGSSLLLIFEAHMAKTDALLLLSVVAAQCSLFTIYVKRDSNRYLSTLFWVAQGFGILIKGPITPIISFLTIITLLVIDKYKREEMVWLRYLRFPFGIAIVLIMVLPWLVVITRVSDGDFIRESLGRDFFSKAFSTQESHGFFPGYYLLLFPVTFFPGTLYLFSRLRLFWRNRGRREVCFALAWIVPSWILFEFMPTKLPHYVLPLYPAIALLIGAFSESINLRRLYYCVAVIIISVFIALEVIAPRLPGLWISREVAGIVNEYRGDRFVSIASVGYHEPSLVFQLGRDTALLDNWHVRNFISMNREAIVIINNTDAGPLLNYAAMKSIKMEKLGEVAGVNYSKGKWLELDIYVVSNLN